MRTKGFGLIEIIVAMGIFVVIAVTAISTITQTFSINRLGDNETDAALYAQEGIEAARSIKNESWTALSSGPHGATSGGGSWAFAGTSDTKGVYTRVITVADIYRDNSGNPVLSGCANMFDRNAKRVASSVDWDFTPVRANNISYLSYLTNWKKTAIGDWSTPAQESGVAVAGDQNALKIQAQYDYSYMVRDGGTPDFVVYDITTTTPTAIGSLSLPGSPTNIFVLGRYAYVTTSDDTELQIIDVCTPSAPSIVGTFAATGGANANGIYVVGTTAYMVRDSSGSDEFIVIDVTTASAPSLIGSLNLGDDSFEVVVLGTNGFVASASNTQELQVLNLTTPSAPTLSGSLNLAGNGNAVTIAGFASSVMVGRNSDEFQTIDVSTPATPTLSGTYNAGDNINDISLGNGNQYAFIATDEPTGEFQVVNITTFATPVLLGSLNFSSDLNGVAYLPANDRTYAATDSNTEELLVVMP
jgi:hypothetical protein